MRPCAFPLSMRLLPAFFAVRSMADASESATQYAPCDALLAPPPRHTQQLPSWWRSSADGITREACRQLPHFLASGAGDAALDTRLYGVSHSEALALIAVIELVGATHFIESGTANGQSTELIARHFASSPLTIDTIDLDKFYHLHEQTQKRLRQWPRVTCHRGDSHVLIPKILERLPPGSRAVVFIDGPKKYDGLKLAVQLLSHGNVAVAALHDVANHTRDSRFRDHVASRNETLLMTSDAPYRRVFGALDVAHGLEAVANQYVQLHKWPKPMAEALSSNGNGLWLGSRARCAHSRAEETSPIRRSGSMRCRLPSPATRVPAAERGYASMCMHVGGSLNKPRSKEAGAEQDQQSAMSCLASSCSMRTHAGFGLPAVTFVDDQLPSDVTAFLADRLRIHVVRLPRQLEWPSSDAYPKPPARLYSFQKYEAWRLPFEQVVWYDADLYLQRDPAPLFGYLDPSPLAARAGLLGRSEQEQALIDSTASLPYFNSGLMAFKTDGGRWHERVLDTWEAGAFKVGLCHGAHHRRFVPKSREGVQCVHSTLTEQDVLVAVYQGATRNPHAWNLTKFGRCEQLRARYSRDDRTRCAPAEVRSYHSRNFLGAALRRLAESKETAHGPCRDLFAEWNASALPSFELMRGMQAVPAFAASDAIAQLSSALHAAVARAQKESQKE